MIKFNNNLWFKAKDIIEILGYENNHNIILKNIYNDDKVKYKNINFEEYDEPIEVDNDELDTIYINESGLYSLIM